MKKTKTRRLAGRIAGILTPLLLSIALAAACFYGSNQAARAEGLQDNVEELYRQSFFELADHVNDMQVALKKLMVVASSQQHVLLLNDIWRLAGAAAANLAALPQSHVDTMSLTRFVIQTGDYAHILSRKVLDGVMLSPADRDQLNKLFEASAAIARDLETRLEQGELPVASLSREDYYQTSQDPSYEDPDSISNYPTLIYDGPFSESTEKAEPQGLSGSDIDQGAALDAALRFLGGGTLHLTDTMEGIMPAYVFSGTDSAGRPLEISVTRRGGSIQWMMMETAGGEEGVPDEQQVASLKAAAQNFLKERGYENLFPTYGQFYSGVAVFNFAAQQDGVILYSDLIKVYVERSSLQVVGFDANNYLFSHRERRLPAPSLDAAAAQGSVSEALEIQSVALALIPKTPLSEVLCYEFKGTCRGASFIVYINAATGSEEEVFEIINSDEGQLVV